MVDGGANGSRVGREDWKLLLRNQVQKGELICIHAIIRPDSVGRSYTSGLTIMVVLIKA